MWRRRELTAALGLVLAPFIVGCAADTFVGGDGAASADGGGDGDAASGCACIAPDVCCVYTGTPTTTYMCAQSCAAPTGGQELSQLACTSTADCHNSEVCCVSRSNNINTSVCQSQCDSNQAQLCDPTAIDSGCSNQSCSTSSISDWKLPPTFGTCGGVGVP